MALSRGGPLSGVNNTKNAPSGAGTPPGERHKFISDGEATRLVEKLRTQTDSEIAAYCTGVLDGVISGAKSRKEKLENQKNGEDFDTEAERHQFWEDLMQPDIPAYRDTVRRKQETSRRPTYRPNFLP